VRLGVTKVVMALTWPEVGGIMVGVLSGHDKYEKCMGGCLMGLILVQGYSVGAT